MSLSPLATTRNASLSQGNVTVAIALLTTTESILARFIFALSTMVPLVLSLNHAEFMSSDEMQALHDLLVDNAHPDVSEQFQSKGILIVLSYNDNSGKPPLVPIKTLVTRLDGAGDAINPIYHCMTVANLSWNDVYQWINEWAASCTDKRLDEETAQGLTDHVYSQSQGNPRHVALLLSWMTHHGMIDGCVGDNSRTDIETNEVPCVGNICDLFQELCKAQDPLVMKIVETTAALFEHSPHCLVTSDILGMMLPQQSCSDALQVAANHDLLECRHGRYQFRSRVLQKAAYGMVTTLERPHMHVRIG